MSNKKVYRDDMGRLNTIDFDNKTQLIDFSNSSKKGTDFPTSTNTDKVRLDMDYDVTERLTGLRRYNRKFVR
jgi:hypothetical protein